MFPLQVTTREEKVAQNGLKWLFVFFNLKMVNVLLFMLLLYVSLRKVSRKNRILFNLKKLNYV